MKYVVEIEKEGYEFTALIRDLNFTSSYGKDESEALENIKEAALLYVEGMEEIPTSNYELDNPIYVGKKTYEIEITKVKDHYEAI